MMLIHQCDGHDQVRGPSSAREKDLKGIVQAAEEQGWRVEQRSGGHLFFYAPDGKNIVTSGSTPSDHRALRNLVTQLRRYGFEWKGR